MQDISVSIEKKPSLPIGQIAEQERAAFVLVEEGNATIEIDFKPYRLQHGNLMLFTPGTHVQYAERSDDFSISIVSFTAEISEEVTVNFEPTFFCFQKEYPVAEINEDDVVFIRHQIHGIRHVLQRSNGEHKTEIMKNMIFCFYMEMYDRTKVNFSKRSADSVSSQEYFFMKFLSLVHKHADTERDLPFYADKLCISTRYLSAIVRNQTGRTAKDFIDAHCLQVIKKRLRTTQDSLQSIAIQMKFPDQSFFSRYFKKQTGMTPKEYRAK